MPTDLLNTHLFFIVFATFFIIRINECIFYKVYYFLTLKTVFELCCSGLLSKWRFNYRYLIAYYELGGLELNEPFFPIFHLEMHYTNSSWFSCHSVQLALPTCQSALPGV